MTVIWLVGFDVFEFSALGLLVNDLNRALPFSPAWGICGADESRLDLVSCRSEIRDGALSKRDIPKSFLHMLQTPIKLRSSEPLTMPSPFAMFSAPRKDM